MTTARSTRFRSLGCRAGLHSWRVVACYFGRYDERCIGCGKARIVGWRSLR